MAAESQWELEPTIPASRHAEQQDATVAAEAAAPVQPGTPPVTEPAGVDALVADPTLDEAAYWQVWGGPIGRTIEPTLVDLQTSLPDLTSAIALTPSGLPICWVGVDKDEAARIGSIVGAAHALGGAAASRAAGLAEDPAHADALHVVSGTSHAVVQSMRDLIVGPLLLWASATDTNLGVLTFQVKGCAEAIRRSLAADDDTTP